MHCSKPETAIAAQMAVALPCTGAGICNRRIHRPLYVPRPAWVPYAGAVF